MRITLPKVRCLEDEPKSNRAPVVDLRQHAFVFAPPRYGPQTIGIVFGRDDHWGNPLTRTVIVDLNHQPADRVLERGELLIVTADNLRLLHVIEAGGMFRRAGTSGQNALRAF
jgi:hypothetical protein